MEPEEKNIIARLIGYATGITAITALVVVSSVAGGNAYLAYHPAALEAQAINISAQDAPVTSTSESTVCQQEIAAAAARGTPDTESVITDQSSLQFEDQCVAAILNPAVTTLGPTDPSSYMCVGKSAKVTVSTAGLITETAVPDAAVPAGTCTAVACSSPGANGQSDCFAASKLTSITGSNVQQDLSAIQNATISPDPGITSFTMNADGSIVGNSANTAEALSSGAGDGNLAGNSASLDQSVISSPAGEPSGVPSIGEAQAVAAQPSQVPEIQAEPPQTQVTDTAGLSAAPSSPVAADTPQTAPSLSGGGVTDQAQASSGSSVPTQTASIGQTGPQPTQATITYSQDPTGNISSTNVPANAARAEAPAPSQNIFERFATTVQTDSINAVNDVRGLLGLPPIEAAPSPAQPGTIGIRG